MIEWLHLAALLLYGIGAAITGVSFARGGRRLPGGAVIAVLLGLVTHGAAMLAFTSRWGELPLVGLGPSLSTLAFLIALGTVAVAVPARAGTVGLVLFPVVVVLGAVGLAMGMRPNADAAHFHSVWFVLHVVSAFLGYAGLTVAAAAGLMYLLQFRELKSKHFGAIFRFFPPLEVLDRIGRWGILAGFPFLTGAVLAVPIAAVVWGIVNVWDGPDLPARAFRKGPDEP